MLTLNLRKNIQLIFFIYTLIIAIWFYIYVQQLKQGNYNIIKPASVEGFLPISAFMGLKKFLLTGDYDLVHPAGLTIFIAAILMSVIVKKSFCSHICPVGFLSEIISNAGFKIKINKWIAYILGSLKYLLLLFFFNAIILHMDVDQITSFQASPYNIVADAKMLHFFLDLSLTGSIIIAFLIVLTYLFKNFWCRFLCPYGALLGIISFLSPFKIKRDRDRCINCKQCQDYCPADIDIYNKKTVFAPNCIGCKDCTTTSTALKQHCLKAIKSDILDKKHKDKLSLIAVSIFLLCFAVAYITGNWNSQVTNEEYAHLLNMIDKLAHP